MPVKLLRSSLLMYCRIPIVFLLSLFCGQIHAQALAQATATGNIFAEVISAFTATETSPLNFGKFSPGPAGGEIILTPANSVSTLGTIYVAPGMKSAGTFYITGDENASFTINLPTEPVVLKLISGSKNMLVKDWNSIPGPGVGAGTLQNGFQTIYIGATLKVGSLEDNPSGVYAGTYTVTIAFN